jgi:hypothetical protein
MAQLGVCAACLCVMLVCAGAQTAETVAPPDMTVLDKTDSAAERTPASVSSAVSITLADGNSRASSTTGLEINNSSNTVKITRPGTYALKGSLSGGQVIVDVDGSVNLILNGANITSKTGAPLALFGDDLKIITLAAGTSNTLADAADYTSFYDDDEPNAALFSKSDLTINGSGTLAVKAGYNNGIGSKDDLKIMSGVISVSAPNNALKGNDSVIIRSGTITLNSDSDGMKSDDEDDDKGYVRIDGGTVTIVSAEDGIDAYRALFIAEGATLTVTAGGGAKSGSAEYTEDTSRKAIKSDLALFIAGGRVNLSSPDDGIHSNGTVIIAGGTISVATNDDGVHADEYTIINGGNITISQSYEGIEGAKVLISGGTITVTSSDDGINGADGTSVFTGFGGRGGFGGFGGGQPWGAAPGTAPNGRGGGTGPGTMAPGTGAPGTSAPGTTPPTPGEQPPAIPEGNTCSITITGGNITVNANGDGLDSNGPLLISGGTVVVHGPSGWGNAALDAESAIQINGGTVFAAGSAQMVQRPSSASSQPCIALTFRSGARNAGTVVEVRDASGKSLGSYTAAKTFQSIIISNPGLATNGTYTIYVNNARAGTATLNGVVTQASI